MDKENIRPMPHSEEAEEAVLGSVLTDNNTYERASQYITSPDMFYTDDNRILWNHIVSMHGAHETIDIVTLSARITGTEKKLVSAYYISGLLDSIPSTDMVDKYSTIVLEKYLQRKLIESSYKVQKYAYDNTMDFNKVLDQVKKYTEELQELQPVKRFDLKEVIDDAVSSIRDHHNVIKYGINVLDIMAGGMTKGEITIIAGRPGHGKTTFAVNLIPKLIDQGLKVMVLNREMTNSEMLKKLMVLESGTLSYRSVRLGDVDVEMAKELERVKSFVIKKYTKNLTMFDNIQDLNGAIVQVNRIKPDVIIDDYIQLIRLPGYDQRRFELEAVMNEYKWIAKSLKCVPILVSQLNREIERRIDPIPKMSDLAESGSIEQVAENILFTYYDYKVNYDQSSFGKHRIQIIAAKVRYGETGMTTLGFDGDKVKFYEEPVEVYIRNKGRPKAIRSKEDNTHEIPFIQSEGKA